MTKRTLAALSAAAAATCAVAIAAQTPDPMVVARAAPSAATKATPHFTGPIAVEAVGKPAPPARVNSSVVTFAPGSRSYWHSHPAGQTLIVTSGTGWVQTRGGRPRLVKAGDVIWTPPGVEHWHGASAGASMTHVALQETVGGRNVDWREPVTDAQYRAAGR